MKLIPIILELDDTLQSGEEFIDIKTIGIIENSKTMLGYVGVIKNFNHNNDIRYCNLKAVKYEGKSFNQFVL